MNKSDYKNFVEQEGLPIFYSNEWLDIVSKGHWEVACVSKNNQVRAIWVYQLKSKLGIKYCLNFQYTPYTGFWFALPQDIKDIDLHEKRLVSELLENIKFDYLYQFQWPEINNSFPFIMNQIEVINKFSYTLPLIDKDTLAKTINQNLITQINKSIYTVVESDNIEKLIHFHNDAYTYKKEKQPFDTTILKSLFNHFAGKNIQIFEIQNDHSCGALLIAYDKNQAYYLAGGTDNSHTILMSQLLFSAMEWCIAKGIHTFDFHGSSNTNIEKFFRKFNPIKKTYFLLKQKNSSKGKIIDMFV